MKENTNELLSVGSIVGAYGLTGEIRVNPSSDFPERFTLAGKRWLQGPNNEIKPVHLESGRQLSGKSLYIIRLQGIHNRTMVENLIGYNLLILSSDRPLLGKGEFHALDLIGLEVRLEPTFELIGYVEDLINGSNHLLEIKLIDEFMINKQNRRVLIPFVESIVPKINLEEKWLSITPPPGLLEI
uniref:16S rRNA-processing protein n=1 Tax=Paulinella micropora TaxID=1928728 RepID=A0A385I0G6_9EUKA|nr:16S rRNA-processing protein [Paulinella micropora]AXY63412.1 16S rRNA-processing protein [Paulinella micropora]